jgi:chromosome segregation ATPase
MTLKLNDALIEIKKSDVAEWEEKAEYSKSEYLKADELLTDKKKEVEQAQGELSKVEEALDEATHKKEIAQDLYEELKAGADNSDLFDKVVDLSYENEQLRSKIQVLQDKLQKAYEFMKQFVINGRNMLDVFRDRIGEVKEWVQRKVAGGSQ